MNPSTKLKADMTQTLAQKLARPNILQLKPYSSAREEFTGNEGIFLDANESPFNKPMNRYPDPFQQRLRQRIADMKGLKKENIILGNGSDETIDMLFRTFCEPGKDRVISVNPTYGMYEVSAGINGVAYDAVTLNTDFSLPVDDILSKSGDNAKLLFLCSPNNPTGNRFADDDMKILLQRFPGLVVVDEAYVDFSNQGSWSSALDEYPNLVVLQTLSKAWGLAAIRLGMAFASAHIIDLLMKVKPPYNVNTLTQQKALQALADPSVTENRVKEIISERERLMTRLDNIPTVTKVFASDANFFLIQVDDPDGMYDYLVERGVIVRNRSKEALCQGCLRLTIGSPAQNDYLWQAIKNFPDTSNDHLLKMSWSGVSDWLVTPERRAIRQRQTKETSISVDINLDGAGKADIQTGLGFFDHMLDQIARHSGCDLMVKVEGDLHIDEHHTLEDTAIALGEAFAEALGDKKGIERYGFALPMDDCAAMVLLDFGGRPELVWKAKFKREKVGELPTEMFEHIFKSFAIGSRCNLYIKAKGENEHHKIEAIFKALARAIKMAIKKEAFSNQLPSTKGLL
jgi:histidinol-phosphate aminotransferase